jgi:hypothetical protein
VFYEVVDYVVTYSTAQWLTLINFYLGQMGPNPGFELNTLATPVNTAETGVGFVLCDSWTILNCDAPFQAFLDTANPNSGAQDILLRLLANQSIAAGATKFVQVSSPLVPVSVGQNLSWGAAMSWYQALALPSGLAAYCAFIVDFYDHTGAYLGNQGTSSPVAAAAIAYTPVGGNYTVPASIGGGTPTQMRLTCYLSVTNSSGGALNTPNGLAADIRFDDVSQYFTALGSNPGVNVVNPFLMLDPEIQAQAQWKFKARPTRKALGGGLWSVGLSLERQP